MPIKDNPPFVHYILYNSSYYLFCEIRSFLISVALLIKGISHFADTMELSIKLIHFTYYFPLFFVYYPFAAYNFITVCLTVSHSRYRLSSSGFLYPPMVSIKYLFRKISTIFLRHYRFNSSNKSIIWRIISIL